MAGRLRTVAIVVQVVAGIAMIVSILLQSGRGAGFSGFTGAGSSGAEFFFGRHKGLDEALGRVTAGIAVVFVILSYALARFWS